MNSRVNISDWGGWAPVADGAEEARGESTLAALERRHVEQALRRHGGNLARTARALGISLSTLKRKARQFRLRDADAPRSG